MKVQAADKRTPVIAGALALTAIFLGLFGWLLTSTTMPADCPSGPWLLDRLSCLSPNELGDTFAGAFAPVAFVWLVAAVMLQRNELAAQRQELRESRLVASQQVEEARKNVLLIGEQTALLKQDRERIQRREVDEDIDEMVSILVQKLRSEISNTYVSESLPIQDSSGNWIYDCQVRAAPSKNDYTELEDYTDGIRDLLIQAGAFAREGVKFHHSGSHSYASLLLVINEIQALREKASPPKKAPLTLRGFDSLFQIVPQLIQVLDAYGLKDEEIPF